MRIDRARHWKLNASSIAYMTLRSEYSRQHFGLWKTRTIIPGRIRQNFRRQSTTMSKLGNSLGKITKRAL